MRKRNVTSISKESLTVGIDELMQILNVGRNTAVRIGRAAGAEVKIGRRVLYIRERVESYLESLAADTTQS